MEKQHTNNKNNNARKAAKKEGVFGGANKVHISEDAASKLVGGIVEKGISSNDNFSTPMPSSSSFHFPSSLPFPVARHRSHGPHWAPIGHPAAVGGGFGDADDREEEGGEDDNDPTNYDPLGDFAKPLKKKNKKGLDFSTWKDFLPSNDVSRLQVKDKSNSVKKGGETLEMDDDAMRCTDKSILDNHPSMDDKNLLSDLHGSQLEREPSDDVDMGTEEVSSIDLLNWRENRVSTALGTRSTDYDHGSMSLKSQIDAENRALLEKMSLEEIAEAQADIRNRIKPELLNVLKKRGLKKPEKQDSSCVTGDDGVFNLGNQQTDIHETQGEKESSGPENITSQPLLTPSLQKSETKPTESAVQNSESKGNSLWNSWSERVEASRNLRFSLDGNVIEGSFLGPTYSADNVAERDFLRTEGDPGAAGYTLKEALALIRSVVPGQRALALHLLASALSNVLHNICKSQLDCTMGISNEKNHFDWEAIWAYALGPEPELVLSLRLAVDDNHSSVVLASVKVIQCILACDVNENFFNSSAKLAMKDLYTAPVFRSRPDIRHGFLHGGYWKYSTKASNILAADEEITNDKNEEKRTIQDDNFVAGQDVAAGLVRMQILPRFCYLLETEPSVALEECILSILIAIARNSPTCANAIWKCERLVQSIVDRFNMKDTRELQASKIKSVTLLRVLAQSSKTTCTEFIKKGFFQIMTWQLYRVTPSIDEWVKSGRENCKLASPLMVEQLRFWKVCIMYGHCISFFTGFFPTLCLWLNPPTSDKIVEANVFNEFTSISMEVYLVLETLATRLPDLCSPQNANQQSETWCWSDVRPMFDMALKWLELKSDSTLSNFLYLQSELSNKFVDHKNYVSSLLWVLSAVMHFLHTVLMKATPGDAHELKGSSKNWKMLPEFVSKLAVQITKSCILKFSDESEVDCSTNISGMGSLVEKLCYFRHQLDSEVSLASVWCLHALLRVVVSTDRLIQFIGDKVGPKYFQGYELAREDKILHDGLLKCSLAQWTKVLSEFMKLVASEWHIVQHIEVFGRGGPAPGVGVGWGASGGGFWSSTVALVQADVRLLIELLETCHSSLVMDSPNVEEKFVIQSINSALASSLVVGPRDSATMHKVLDFLLQVPVLKYLDQCILHFLHCYQGQGKPEHKESELLQLGQILASHYKNRWLAVKGKKDKPEVKDGNSFRTKIGKMDGNSLGTIPEDMEPSDVVTGEDRNSVSVEWAHQRMPLPLHWVLSPVATICDIRSGDMPNATSGVPHMQDPMENLDITKAGLFFLLGIEAMSFKLSDNDHSPVRSIPLIWRLHSLSVQLLLGMGVLEEERSRDMYEALQNLYGRYLDELPLSISNAIGCDAATLADLSSTNCLRFQSEIHESYSTFIETLVEQFAAISYGDIIYGRQIAIYLHRKVETSVRLVTWNTLSNGRVLDLLPPLDKCLSHGEGYLEPVEEDDAILEAYVKSWTSGCLDRAATRGSATYTIVLHHLSSFIFKKSSGETSLLQKKLVRSLLWDYSSKQQHEAMMLDLILYNRSSMIQMSEPNGSISLQMDYTSQRLELLKEICGGSSQLLSEVDKLISSVTKKQSRS